MKRIILPFIFAAVFSGCSLFDDSSKAGLEEMGLPVRDYVLDFESVIVEVPFYANGNGHITPIDDCPWVQVNSPVFSTDGTALFHLDDNDGLPRMARFLFTLDCNPSFAKDTLTLRQKGYREAYLKLEKTAVALYNGEGESTVELPFETSLPISAISVDRRTFEDEDWVKSVEMKQNALEVKVSPNSTPDRRTAVITMSYDNGWGQTVKTDIRVVQAGSDNSFGRVASFEELRGMATAQGIIAPRVLVEAYVVSNTASGNMGENPMLSPKTIDYSVCRRTAYIQSTDCSYGFMVVTDSEADNIFEEDTRVLLDLADTRIVKMDNPERYVIENLSQSAFLNVESAAAPEKIRQIGELTDSDIYTRVTLSDVEWPVRKGSLTPCYEYATNSCNNDYITKCATLLRGRDGGSMYIYTNTTCPYRRDGTRMGYGSGTVRGVIVHEKHIPFVDKDAPDAADCGNIGRYQIRHCSREDFHLADSFSDSFSEMICEWRYIKTGADKELLPTYGKGRLTQTGPDHSYYDGFNFNGMSYYDFSYLGPVGNNRNYIFGNNRGNVNGFGIILEDGTDYGLSADTRVLANTDGCGRTNRETDGNLAWGAVCWWDMVNATPYHWLLEFSTKDLSTDRLSMQLQMLNQNQSGKSPRYWKIEWSSDKNEEWQALASFTLPDIIPTSYDPQLWMSGAFKPMDFPLPLDMLDCNKVYIRIGPENNKASDRKEYDNTTVPAVSLCAGTMNYLAIRYNK